MYVIITHTSVLRATGSELFMDINEQNVPPTDSHLVYKIIVRTICMHTVLVAIYIIIFYTSTNMSYTYKSHMPHTGTHTHTGTHRNTGTHRHTQAHRHRCT